MRKWLTILVALGLLAAMVLPVLAVAPVTPNDRYEIQLPEFDSYTDRGFTGTTASRVVEQNLAQRYGGAWEVYAWNSQTSTPRWVYGAPVRVGNAVRTAADVELLGRQVIDANVDVLGADGANLRLASSPRIPGQVGGPLPADLPRPRRLAGSREHRLHRGRPPHAHGLELLPRHRARPDAGPERRRRRRDRPPRPAVQLRHRSHGRRRAADGAAAAARRDRGRAPPRLARQRAHQRSPGRVGHPRRRPRRRDPLALQRHRDGVLGRHHHARAGEQLLRRRPEPARPVPEPHRERRRRGHHRRGGQLEHRGHRRQPHGDRVDDWPLHPGLQLRRRRSGLQRHRPGERSPDRRLDRP